MAGNEVKIKLSINTVANISGAERLLSALNAMAASMKKASSGEDASKLEKFFDSATAKVKGLKEGSREFNKVMADPKAQDAIKNISRLYEELMIDFGKMKNKEMLPSSGPLGDKINSMKGYADILNQQTVSAEKSSFFANKLDGAVTTLAEGGLAKMGLSLGEVAAMGGTAAKVLPGVGIAVMVLSGAAQMATAVFKQWGAQLKDFAQGLVQLWQGLKNSVGALRLVAQGFLTIARSMTFFISAPVLAFMKKGTEAALEMESALIRVAKVTGTLFDNTGAIGDYRDELAKIAVVSASSMEELANFSEQLGQIGVRDKDGLLELVAILDVVSTSTKMVADNIATDLGAIANAYGHSTAATGQSLRDTITFIDRSAEVINALENSAGVTASEVVEMLKDVGSTFSGLTATVEDFDGTLKLNVAQVAGWASAAKKFGMTASEVGTAMRRLPAFLLENADAIDTLDINTERFSNSLEFVNGLHSDFYNTVDSLITVLASDRDAMNTVAASTELMGVRTGRLVQNLVKAKQATDTARDGLSEYDRIMRIATDAWASGNSLMTEYNKMLDTTRVKTDMLKSGFQNFSMVVGDDLVPVLNRVIEVASAGVMAFTDLYKSVGAGTKKIVGSIVAFAALYGPVSWFLSQTVFGITMVMNGMMRLGSFILPLVSLFKKLIFGLFTLNPVLILIGGTLYSLFNTYLGGMKGIEALATKLFTNLTKNAGNWGKTLMDTFAGGIIAGSKAVITALGAVAKSMAAFLEAHSPPKEGPLSGIDMWGAVLMNTYLKGFANADFSILSDVAGKIEGILGSINFTPSGDDDEKERKSVLKGLIKFREQFTKLLKDNRAGVKITDEYLSRLVQGLGTSTDEVKALVRAHLDLERVQQRLADIEKERANVSKRYEDQVELIRLSGASAEDMVESIASAAYERDRSNEALSEEEKLLKEREELFKSQLEFQQDLLDALQEQSDLWKELLTLQSGAGSGSATTSTGGGIEPKDFGMDELQSKLKEAQERFIDLRVKAMAFQVVLWQIVEAASGFWQVLRGADPDTVFADFEAKVMAHLSPKEWGKTIISDYSGLFGDIETTADAENFLKSYGNDIVTGLATVLPAGDIKTMLTNFVSESLPDDAGGMTAELNSLINNAFASVVIEPENMNMAVSEIFTGAADATAQIQGNLPYILEVGGQIQGLFTGGLVQGIKDFFGAIATGFSSVPEEDDGMLTNFGNNLKYVDEHIPKGNPLLTFGENIGAIAKVLIQYGPPLLDSLGKLALSLSTYMVEVFGIETDGKSASQILQDVLTLLTNIVTKVTNVVDWLGKVRGKLDAFGQITTKLNPVYWIFRAIQTAVEAISSALGKISWDKLKFWKSSDGKQGGGWMMAGGVSKVNEAGPELFSAPFRGKVTSHSLTTKMLHDLQLSDSRSGGGMVININNPVIRDEQNIDQLVDTLMYRIAQEI